MHKYRRAARFSAWYDEEGEPTNYNPFRKITPRPRRSQSGQLESGLVRSSTTGEIRTSEERQRRKGWSEGLGGPEQSDTFPQESTNTQEPEPAEEPKGSKEIPEESRGNIPNEPVNISNTEDTLVDHDSRPRQRKNKLVGLFKKDKEDSGDLESTRSGKYGEDKQKFTFVGQLKATIFNSWINVLLLAAPAGIIINYLHLDPRAIFVVNFIAIVPLAAMLSYATEEIALRTGETIGGLLNATFGNAVELIVAILALVDDQVIIVQTSLIGSMLSNLLLVMGMCFFFGGVNRMDQKFNEVVAQTAASLLSLAVGSLIIPTAFGQWANGTPAGIAALSRGTSVMLLIVYGAYLIFQLLSHVEIYNKPSPKTQKRSTAVAGGDARKGLANIGRMTATVAGQNATDQVQMADPDDEREAPQLSILVAVITLAVSTAFVALCAEFMVDSINDITESGGISKTFVGLILLPIVGNAAEHATAVTVAVKDKMDLAIGVAVGSSMQIALLVLPLVVVVGWIMGRADMTLDFNGFQITILFVAVLLVNYLIADGKSHWLEGVMLMTLYLIIAIAAWFFPT